MKQFIIAGPVRKTFVKRLKNKCQKKYMSEKFKYIILVTNGIMKEKKHIFTVSKNFTKLFCKYSSISVL